MQKNTAPTVIDNRNSENWRAVRRAVLYNARYYDPAVADKMASKGTPLQWLAVAVSDELEAQRTTKSQAYRCRLIAFEHVANCWAGNAENEALAKPMAEALTLPRHIAVPALRGFTRAITKEEPRQLASEADRMGCMGLGIAVMHAIINAPEDDKAAGQQMRQTLKLMLDNYSSQMPLPLPSSPKPQTAAKLLTRRL